MTANLRSIFFDRFRFRHRVSAAVPESSVSARQTHPGNSRRSLLARFRRVIREQHRSVSQNTMNIPFWTLPAEFKATKFRKPYLPAFCMLKQQRKP
jgi:hypothetical protein